MTSCIFRFRFALAALLLSFAIVRPAAAATDYTDIWWGGQAESGWGVNFIQSNNFIFATFFIYANNGDPGWVSAQLTKTGDVWSGPIYVTTGTFYGAPWNPANSTATQAGTATFEPFTSNTGALMYTIGNTQVNKAIVRQTLTAIPIDGTYVGGATVKVTGCSNPNNNGVLTGVARVTAELAVPATFKLAFVVNFDGGTQTFMLSGKPVQEGTQYRMTAGTLVPDAGTPLAAAGSQIKRTATGLEGLFTVTANGGCIQSWTFSAVQSL